MKDSLQISCAELRELADSSPDELEVIVDMMIEAEEELCSDLGGTAEPSDSETIH